MIKKVLRDAKARVVVFPQLGGGVAAYDFLLNGKAVPVLRPCCSTASVDVFALASNVMVPWANRISGGGFHFAGKFIGLDANIAGERLPLHGNALQEPWEVVTSADDFLVLQLRSRGPAAFDYLAQMSFKLSAGSLHIDLAVTHQGPGRLPYGIGFHPWFIRTPKTALQARMSHVWLMDGSQLPCACIPIIEKRAWDFSQLRRLPDDCIDNPFAGWDQMAILTWPENGIMATVNASASLRYCHLYAPSKEANFFCFEPVSHPVDEHNQAKDGDYAGLAVLESGQTLSGNMEIKPDRLKVTC